MIFNPKNYDSSWDDDNEDLWDEKYKEWEKRDWESWLLDNLSFPFEVERVEDEDDAFFIEGRSEAPFRLGHKMKVTGIEYEDGRYGVLAKVREGRKTGYVPLCDVEVTDRKNLNFWPVREYVVWFANR